MPDMIQNSSDMRSAVLAFLHWCESQEFSEADSATVSLGMLAVILANAADDKHDLDRGLRCFIAELTRQTRDLYENRPSVEAEILRRMSDRSDGP